MVAGGHLFEPCSRYATAGFRWIQAIIISVYFYSSLGKLDYQFLHTVGQQLLGAMFALTGQDVMNVAWELRLLLAALLPLSELLLAAGLLYAWLSRSRLLTWFGLAAVIFHLTLVLILGYQLQHSLGVVLWNVQFTGLAVILFMLGDVTCQQESSDDANHPQPAGHKPSPGTLWTAAVSLAVIVLPLGERWGYWDHWPSWALYAPHSSRVEVLVAPQAVGKLPRSLQALMQDAAETDELGWQRVPLASWSLEQLAAPIYPQARFQLQVAKELAADVDSPFQVQAVVLSSAGRFSGSRTEKRLSGSQEIMDFEL